MTANEQWCLIERPEAAVEDRHFEVRNTDIPVPGANEVLVRNLYLLIPPSMRLWMNERETYFPPQPLGEVMTGITLGVVESSNVPELQPGDYVNGLGGCQKWFVANPDSLQKLQVAADLPLELYRTVIDVQGLTAWCGLTEVGRPQKGETLVVTAAAGSVGSLVCQIGKKIGLNVVGIAGGPDKCEWLRQECGIENVIDYKADDVAAQLDEMAPSGVDLAFESVGGPVMDLIIDRLNFKGRVILCGLVSSYNGAGGTQSTESLMRVVNKAARIEGFLVSEYMHRYADVTRLVEGGIREGWLKYRVDVIDGLDNFVDALGKVFRGENKGIQLIRIAPEETGNEYGRSRGAC
jgi:NADPH-dependent curcumin reductase CurA